MRLPVDPASAAAGDPSGMLEAFLRLPEQLVVGYEAGRSASLRAVSPRSLILCGMGGSAAGGDVVASAFAERLAVPAASVRGYTVPAWCGPEDLVLGLSFSGGTEETISCLEDARARGAIVAAVCSGGPLADLVGEQGLVRIPADAPMPRAGLGLLAGGALGALVTMGLLAEADAEVREAAQTLTGLAEELGPGRPRNEAVEVARAVGSQHVPVAWGSGLAEPAAFRWKAAFNENAKTPAFSSSLPELNHHEIAGWSEGRGHGFLLLALRHPGEHGAVGAGLEAAYEVIEESGIGWREVHARGETPLSHSLSLILVGDVASVYHALARGVDPAPIVAIDRLKQRLGG